MTLSCPVLLYPAFTPIKTFCLDSFKTPTESPINTLLFESVPPIHLPVLSLPIIVLLQPLDILAATPLPMTTLECPVTVPEFMD